MKTKAKNEIHAALIRRLIEAPKLSDLFGLKGRRWLEAVQLPMEERETVDGCLRQIDFCEAEIAGIERAIVGRGEAEQRADARHRLPGAKRSGTN